MGAQNRQFFLWAAFIVLSGILYNAWVQEQHKNRVADSGAGSVTQPLSHAAAAAQASKHDADIPQLLTSEGVRAGVVHPAKPKTETLLPFIHVRTDVFDLDIDPMGGDIVRLTLLQYAKNHQETGAGFPLFDQGGERYYLAQSGLASAQGPDVHGMGRALLHCDQQDFSLSEDATTLTVDLKTRTQEGQHIVKRFVFERSSYAIKVQYLIDNQGPKEYSASFYARLKRKPIEEAGMGFLGVQTFTGAAIHTQETPFKKIQFKDMAKKPFERTVTGGWAAMVEHYFVGAWIPEKDIQAHYQANQLSDNLYSVGWVASAVLVPVGAQKTITSTLYAGPEVVETLAQLGPGLDLAVDYGILWPLCQPIFWLLQKMYAFSHNWGLAIILTTILIKSLFYKLSATSYRSMGNMRKLQPKMESLKERYADDKQKLSQAMMELYKKEKINPFGGCLPVLVQIPVFIALYYVLLGSVALREAPFLGWIHDLSAKDPFYVLPLLMGLSMLVQQKLNPAPADPVQAKVMMFMPVVFTVLFLNFPSGLVLYWFVNNVLSILQQWFITRSIEQQAKVL